MLKSGRKITVVKGKTKRVHDLLMKKLTEFNHAKAGESKWKVMALEMHGPKKELLGGLYGGTFWGWAYIELLWVDEKVRGTKVGESLVSLAEKIAKQRGCKNCFLSTFSFQAPGFYKKLGYKVFGKMSHFPTGHSRMWLQKAL